jgi:serine acetyltransferase
MADIGEFCIMYHNVSIVWNGFMKITPSRPRIGDCVLIGNGAIIVGDVTVGSNVLIGAGAVVHKSVPDNSLVVNQPMRVIPREPSEDAAAPGSERHLKDFYSVWR